MKWLALVVLLAACNETADHGFIELDGTRYELVLGTSTGSGTSIVVAGSTNATGDCRGKPACVTVDVVFATNGEQVCSPMSVAHLVIQRGDNIYSADGSQGTCAFTVGELGPPGSTIEVTGITATLVDIQATDPGTIQVTAGEISVERM